MNISIQVKNIKEALKKFDSLKKDLEQPFREVIIGSAQLIRGEAIKDMSDVFRIKTLCEATPNTTWWVPTRAWRNKGLKQLIEDVLFPLKNVAINASLDPSNTKEEEQLLKDSGWATMYFGDDIKTTSSVGDRRYLCPKTHKKLKICDTCKGGCFSKVAIGRTSHVHLSQH